jgi:hypothetical protein
MQDQHVTLPGCSCGGKATLLVNWGVTHRSQPRQITRRIMHRTICHLAEGTLPPSNLLRAGPNKQDLRHDWQISDLRIITRAPKRRRKESKMREICLNQTEAPARWKISPKTLERWHWVGDGSPLVKIGCRVVYRIEDVYAFERTALSAAGAQY